MKKHKSAFLSRTRFQPNWILFLLLPFIGCIDEISLTPNKGLEPRLVVQGELKKGNPSVARVRLTTSTDFLENTRPFPIENAQVFLLDEQSNEINLPEIEEGVYQGSISSGNSSFVVQTGRSYKLRIQTEEGITYESIYEPLLDVPQPDSISLRVETRNELNNSENLIERNFVSFEVSTPLTQQSSDDLAYLRWQFGSTFQFTDAADPSDIFDFPKTCYVNQSLNRAQVVVFDGNSGNSDYLNRFFILEQLANFRFSQGFYLNVYQQSLSPTAFEYWDKVSKATSLSGGLFEAAPGQIESNIKNVNDSEEEVLGFFYCYEETLIRRFVRPIDVKAPNLLCLGIATQDAFDSAPSSCRNCLDFNSTSTLQRPGFWNP